MGKKIKFDCFGLLKAYGNAIVPQVAVEIMKGIKHVTIRERDLTKTKC